MKTIRYILLTLCFVSTAYLYTATAQTQYDVVVQSAFSPSISDAQEKINEKAAINDTSTVTKQAQYTIFAPAYMYIFEPEPIKAPKVGRDQITRLYRNYLKFGLGNYWTPYLDLEFNSLRSTKYAIGVSVFHHSSWGKIKTYAPAGYSDSRLKVFGQRFFKNYILAAEGGYEHNLFHTYGFQPDSVFGASYGGEKIKIEKKTIARHYHHAFSNLSYRSGYSPDKHRFNQEYALGYDFITDNNQHSYEHQFDLGVSLDKDVAIKKAGYINFGGEMGLYYQHNRWKNTSLTDNWIVNFNPHATWKHKEYFLKAGFDIAVSMEPNKINRFHIYPDIEAHLEIVPNVFAIHAGWDGGLKMNSYLQTYLENPYLSDILSLSMIDQKSRLFLGLQTSISKSITIGAGLSYSFYQGLPVFVPDTNQSYTYKDTTVFLNNTFVVNNNNNEKTQLLNAYFDISYHYKDLLTLGLNLQYNGYFQGKNATWLYAWYKPSFLAQFNSQYTLLKKFVFKLDFNINAWAYYPEFIGGNVKGKRLEPTFDFDFGFEYKWSKRLAFFADFNNFPCQRNRTYFDYPNQRINVLIGVKYNFGGETIKKSK